MTDVLVFGLSEKEIIEGCIKNKREHQELFYKYYSPQMFGICLRYANDYHAAEDILQEGFIKVFKNLEKFRGEGSFEGWVKRIFINTAIEFYRKSANHKGHSELDKVRFKEVEQVAIENLAAKDLLNLIQKLSPGYQTVFNMYVIDGFSHKEIGKKLGIADGTSKSQLARARSILQKMIVNQN